MIKLKYYSYSMHFIKHEVWFTVSFISEREWTKFWEEAADGIFRYVNGTCPELDTVFLISTGFPRTINFKTELEKLVPHD